MASFIWHRQPIFLLEFFRNQVASICVKPPFGGLADVLLAGRAVAEFLAR
jgi:hypothetical protein